MIVLKICLRGGTFYVGEMYQNHHLIFCEIRLIFPYLHKIYPIMTIGIVR